MLKSKHQKHLLCYFVHNLRAPKAQSSQMLAIFQKSHGILPNAGTGKGWYFLMLTACKGKGGVWASPEPHLWAWTAWAELHLRSSHATMSSVRWYKTDEKKQVHVKTSQMRFALGTGKTSLCIILRYAVVQTRWLSILGCAPSCAFTSPDAPNWSINCRKASFALQSAKRKQKDFEHKHSHGPWINTNCMEPQVASPRLSPLGNLWEPVTPPKPP